MKSRAGQATIEYIALLLLLSCILTSIGVAAFAPGIVNATVGSIRYAICVVSGQRCEPMKDPPCVTNTTAVRDHLEATVLFIKVGRDHMLLWERLSDGSIAITVLDQIDFGGELGLGIRAALAGSGKSIALSAKLRAALLAEVGHARTYIASNEEAARGIVHNLGEASDLRWFTAPIHLVQSIQGNGPYHPDLIYINANMLTQGGVSAALFKGKLGVDVDVDHMAGVRFDRRSGEKTMYLKYDKEVLGQFDVLITSFAGSYAKALTISVVLDSKGVPQRLAILGAGAGDSGANKKDREGKRFEVEATLDLHDHENQAAFSRLLAAWQHPGKGTLDMPAALSGLAQRFRDHARLDFRLYKQKSKSQGVDGSITLGIGLGGAVKRSEDSLTLVDATSKPDGGLWERRYDCL